MNKTLIYGCGERLKFTLGHFDIDTTNVDFTDSNENVWGKVFNFITGKKTIIPRDHIQVNDYALCLIGSLYYKVEIKEELLKLGFQEYQIIPFGYINSLWERWKKQDEFYTPWKRMVEKYSNFRVIKDWYFINGNAECILGIRDSIFNKAIFNVFDVYKQKRDIEVVDLAINKKIQLNNDECGLYFNIFSDEMVIKISVKDATIGIPWIMVRNEGLPELDTIEKSKLGRNLLRNFIRLERIPYYDEDYLAIKRAENLKGTILDIGAQFGQSIYAFSYLTKECKIISIEANPNCYQELKILKDIIDDKNRIELIQCGVSDKAGSMVFYEPVNPAEAGSFDSDFLEGRKLGVDVNEIILKVAPMDEIILYHEDIWFIKMDVEGLEYQALKGAKDIIKQNHPLILIEQNERLPEIKEYLKEEYEVYYYDLYTDKFIEHRHSRLNCWLIPKEQYRSTEVKTIVEGRV